MSREPSYIEGCGIIFMALVALTIGGVFAHGIYEDYYLPKPKPTIKTLEKKALGCDGEFAFRELVTKRLRRIEQNQEEILKKLGGREVEKGEPEPTAERR